jgi:hypothetical protein
MCDALAMSRVKRGQKSALPTPGCLNRQGVLRRWPQRYSIATYSDVTILSQPKTTTKLQTGLWMIDTRGWLSAEATHILSDTLLASPHYCSSTTPEPFEVESEGTRNPAGGNHNDVRSASSRFAGKIGQRVRRVGPKGAEPPENWSPLSIFG